MQRKIIIFFATVIGLSIFVAGFYGVRKSLPAGVGVMGEGFDVPADSVRFLSDVTYVNEEGDRVSEQEIFDEVLFMIDEAQDFILLDMFLYNAFQGKQPERTRPLSEELTSALIEKKRENPDISITVISDPINTVYGGMKSEHFSRLRKNGIAIVITDLSKLRDSNPLYSAFWRLGFQWLDAAHTSILNKRYTFRWATNPLMHEGEPITLRAYLNLFNFKANHRKLIVADYAIENEKRKIATLITSANPHDGSSAHTNVAIRVDDYLWRDVVESERAVVRFSDGGGIEGASADVEDESGDVRVQLLTERAIQQKAVELIEQTTGGDGIDLVMFYLADDRIIEALIAAVNRDVDVRLVLDPNKDAFGREKNGVPNRPVAAYILENTSGTARIRWCDTHGEQCHSKMLLVRRGEMHSLMLGSANFTRRNIENYNLETDVLVEGTKPAPVFEGAYAYVDRIWNNEGGETHTAAYDKYAEKSLLKHMLWRIMEELGTSSF